jgi:NDP-sugar pyrophosphorylase family protein
MRRAGIIAAGKGERLRRGVEALKPLVPISGRPLVARVLASIAEAAPADVAIIINDDSLAVRDTVQQADWPFAIDWIVETTPSSMHSFLRIVERLSRDGDPGPFLLSTVDTVASPGAYRTFAATAASIDADVVLAVNTPGDDEKPLLVNTDAEGFVTALGDDVEPLTRRSTTDTAPLKRSATPDTIVRATAGFYMVRPTILREADAARTAGLTALRLFLAHLLSQGYRIAAVPVAPSVDVDYPVDITAAEAFLKGVTA